jgi:1-acyl-sn-glycerol-3-phosphate acyltransferase
VKQMRLNRWDSGKILIRSLPAIPTAGLSLDDMPELIEQCREQMRECIASMDRQILAG